MVARLCKRAVMEHRIEFRITGHLTIEGEGYAEPPHRHAARIVSDLLDRTMSSIQHDDLRNKSHFLTIYAGTGEGTDSEWSR